MRGHWTTDDHLLDWLSEDVGETTSIPGPHRASPGNVITTQPCAFAQPSSWDVGLMLSVVSKNAGGCLCV